VLTDSSCRIVAIPVKWPPLVVLVAAVRKLDILCRFPVPMIPNTQLRFNRPAKSPRPYFAGGGSTGSSGFASGNSCFRWRLDVNSDPTTIPRGKTDAIAATFAFDVRGAGISGDNTPFGVEVGSAFPIRISFKS
jgi:hypothetical protein